MDKEGYEEGRRERSKEEGGENVQHIDRNQHREKCHHL
jgi:hypothetical protein